MGDEATEVATDQGEQSPGLPSKVQLLSYRWVSVNAQHLIGAF